MKFSTLALLPSLAVAGVVNTGAAQRDAAEDAALKDQIKASSLYYRRPYRDFVNSRYVANTEDVLAGAPKTTIPRVAVTKGSYFPEAKRVTIRYGPFLLPPANKKTLESMLLKVNGITNQFDKSATKPCDECTLLALDAELQYADGSVADAKTGAWLHHTGMVNTGAGLKDALCGTPGIENFFEEGNERSFTFYTSNTTDVKAGFKIKPSDKFFMLNEFVNMKNEPQYVWVAFNYELLDGPRPDYKSSHYMLLSVGPSCSKVPQAFGVSNLTLAGQPKKGKTVFLEHSVPWVSPYDGIILGTGGHLHDGGESVKIYQNRELLCNSVAQYADKPAAEGGMGGKGSMKDMGADKSKAGSYESGAAHIQKMTACAVGGPIKKGDQIRLDAAYNFKEHKGMKDNHGDLDEVMGMAGFLVAEN